MAASMPGSGRPIDPGLVWNAADRMILARAFEQVDSLADLFGLKDKADGWLDRIAASAIQRPTWFILTVLAWTTSKP